MPILHYYSPKKIFMKIRRFLTVATLVVLAYSLTSCNKEPEQIVLTGSWGIDTASTALAIIYNQVVAEENPVALNYLKENKNRILALIKKPETLVFSGTNSVVLKSEGSADIAGTYTQSDFYFTVTALPFPKGLYGASDNKLLELYYSKEHMMSLLYSILTPNDPPASVFDQLIDKFEGIGVYNKLLLPA